MDTAQKTFPPIVDLRDPDLGLVAPDLIAEITSQGNAVVARLASDRVGYQDSIYGFLRPMGGKADQS